VSEATVHCRPAMAEPVDDPKIRPACGRLAELIVTEMQRCAAAPA